MGFREGSFAKVWKVENKGNYAVAQMSTSKKDKQSGEYETDWNDSFVRLIGTASNQVVGKEIPKSGLSVKIGQCEVTSRYDKEKKITYTNYAIFNFHEDDGGSKPNTKPTTAGNKPPADEEEDSLPF